MGKNQVLPEVRAILMNNPRDNEDFNFPVSLFPHMAPLLPAPAFHRARGFKMVIRLSL